MRPKKKRTAMTFVKKHKHTITAWVVGIVALTAVMVIIIFQMSGDFS